MAPNLPAPLVAPMPAATELFFPGGDRDPLKLLFVGRLNEQKGVEMLIRSLPLLRFPATLDVVGSGEDEVGLRSLAGSLGVGDRVTWRGALPQQQLAPLYRRAAALVVPSREEGLGLVAVEAQLCETPVVAFDSGGLRDIVQDQRTGILVTDQRAEGLAAAVDALLASPEMAATLGRAGREFAFDTFAPEAVARRYLDIYRDAVGERS
jgi:glycosyltransferase involved in cell wall biosynthesis